MTRVALILALLSVALPASAQEPAPRAPSGPAEVIERAREAREAPRLPADHPPLPADHPEVPVTEESVRLALSGAETARAQPDSALPPGTISVHVVDQQGAPIQNERVRLGIMRADGGRSEVEATTDAEGVALFTALTTGNEQSYRPSVEAEGARVAANPFRLEPDRGQRVELRRLPVTRDPRYLLQALASTQLEFRQPGRVRVTQGARLLNPTTHVYVFPDEGYTVQLPRGVVAFQSRASMGDQRVVPTDEGFRLEGSVPPGNHELVWAYDLPLTGDTFELEMPMAFKSTMGHRVIVDQVEGMSAEVEGMPDAFAHTMNGKRYLIVERRMRATDPPIETLRVRLTNIPAEGSLRAWAVWISAALVLLGLVSFLTARARPVRSSPMREAEVTRLVGEIRSLDRDRADGSIGPEYHQRAREEKMAELAELIDEPQL
jgi:hypothetical protein